MARYNSETQEGKCIFCKIAKKEIPPIGNGTFWEDEKFMAILNPFPNTKGSAFIITKKHYGSDVLKMSDEDLSEFIIATKKVSKILTSYFEDVGRIGVITEGTGVNHAHIKLFPMHGTEHMKKGIFKQYQSNVDKFFEKYEGYISSHDGPKADENKIENLAKELKKIKI
jgi:diadenosine tetraphosphate (Ap4A) HIT family hydrolase